MLSTVSAKGLATVIVVKTELRFIVNTDARNGTHSFVSIRGSDVRVEQLSGSQAIDSHISSSLSPRCTISRREPSGSGNA
jgi:hypothetical protein